MRQMEKESKTKERLLLAFVWAVSLAIVYMVSLKIKILFH